MWHGEVKSKYERNRLAAEAKVAQEKENEASKNDGINAGTQPVSTPRSTRKKASSISQSSAGNLKGLRTMVNESLQGKRANVLGVESSH